MIDRAPPSLIAISNGTSMTSAYSLGGIVAR